MPDGEPSVSISAGDWAAINENPVQVLATAAEAEPLLSELSRLGPQSFVEYQSAVGFRSILQPLSVRTLSAPIPRQVIASRDFAITRVGPSARLSSDVLSAAISEVVAELDDDDQDSGPLLDEGDFRNRPFGPRSKGDHSNQLWQESVDGVFEHIHLNFDKRTPKAP